MFSVDTNYGKLKTNLRLAIERLKLLEKKKTELAQKARKEIADYIASGKVERAKIRVEYIIREDYMVEALELLEMYCDILLSRFGLITQTKGMDPSLAEAISSLLWVAPHLTSDISEMKVISDQLTIKYGKKYTEACRLDAVETISEKLKHKMSVQAPPKILVEKYLIEIAKNYNVPYEPDPQVMREDEQAKGVDALLFGGDNDLGSDTLGPRPPGFRDYPPPPLLPNNFQPFAYPSLGEKRVNLPPSQPYAPPPAALSYNIPPPDDLLPSYDSAMKPSNIPQNFPPMPQPGLPSPYRGNNSQVEAIELYDSFTEDFRSNRKDKILQIITKIDHEISKAEIAILKLKKKEQELTKGTCCIGGKKETEDVDVLAQQVMPRSLEQKIYTENRRRALQNFLEMEKFAPKVELPFYNQPSDTEVYHNNSKRHMLFKKKLVEHLRRKKQERESREKYLTETYSKLKQDWQQKVEKIVNSENKRVEDAKRLELFEKIFPDLKKRQKNRERFSRVRARISSETNLEQMMDRFQVKEMEDKKMRLNAVIPPLLLDAQQRQYCYINNNGKIDDFTAENNKRQILNMWTKEEKEIFKENFFLHHKNFYLIASFLDRKSVCDCVQYYYLTKKEENYKRLLRKSRQRTRSSGVGGMSGVTSDFILSGATGVTTRLQRELMQKQEKQSDPPAPNETPFVPSSAIRDPVETRDNNWGLNTAPLQPVLPLTESAKELNIESKNKKRKKERKKKKKERNGDAKAEDLLVPQDGQEDPLLCVVCNTTSEMTRALTPSQALQYRLREEDVTDGARVCNICLATSVHSHYTRCPLPTCPYTTEHRPTRLQPLPKKWSELPHHIRNVITAEFKIPNNVTECCSCCYDLISHKITLLEENDAFGGGSSPCLRNNEEFEGLKHRNKWPGVSEIVQSTEFQHQCKNFLDEGQQVGELRESQNQALPTTASSSVTLRDVMLGVIEVQLMKNKSVQGGSESVPTTSSMALKADNGFVKSS